MFLCIPFIGLCCQEYHSVRFVICYVDSIVDLLKISLLFITLHVHGCVYSRVNLEICRYSSSATTRCRAWGQQSHNEQWWITFFVNFILKGTTSDTNKSSPPIFRFQIEVLICLHRLISKHLKAHFDSSKSCFWKDVYDVGLLLLLNKLDLLHIRMEVCPGFQILKPSAGVISSLYHNYQLWYYVSSCSHKTAFKHIIILDSFGGPLCNLRKYIKLILIGFLILNLFGLIIIADSACNIFPMTSFHSIFFDQRNLGQIMCFGKKLVSWWCVYKFAKKVCT